MFFLNDIFFTKIDFYGKYKFHETEVINTYKYL